jgi:cytochrome c oxidase subunit 2
MVLELANGETVKADETYIRESILQPGAKIVAGYQPIMPTFQGLVTEEGLLQLVEYIKSLAAPQQGQQPIGGVTPRIEGGPAGPAPAKPSISGTTPSKR